MDYSLNNISPIDGRYSKITKNLNQYFSESGLIKYRLYIEIQYFIKLHQLGLPQLKSLKKSDINLIESIYRKSTIKDIKRIKAIESITNHDVKAIEYYIKEKFDLLGLTQYKEFIHFGLTSQDINNTATPLLFKDSLNNILVPQIKNIIHISLLNRY